ncbi:hypothetical protein V6N12_070527 [Hibiscus sabdariffa]|uniref:Uncharacterized protein n=1 Tax=Hibiscus sabdariffa TaxID=183260 RepID=A0ABR2FH98_9ROSI
MCKTENFKKTSLYQFQMLLENPGFTFCADSFISIKFEENGVGSWEKGKVSKVSLENCSMSWNPTLGKGLKEGNKSVIEHSKPGGSLRWRKRMGHLFQLVRWKRSTGKAEGVKAMKKSWITRTLTKRT